MKVIDLFEQEKMVEVQYPVDSETGEIEGTYHTTLEILEEYLEEAAEDPWAEDMWGKDKKRARRMYISRKRRGIENDRASNIIIEGLMTEGSPGNPNWPAFVRGWLEKLKKQGWTSLLVDIEEAVIYLR